MTGSETEKSWIHQTVQWTDEGTTAHEGVQGDPTPWSSAEGGEYSFENEDEIQNISKEAHLTDRSITIKSNHKNQEGFFTWEIHEVWVGLQADYYWV